jgi:hypothetical protein
MSPTPPGTALAAENTCAFKDQNATLPRVAGAFAWHLGEEFSQLKSAREAIGDASKVRIAHLDTGYDPNHITCPTELRSDLQRNVIDGTDDASDPQNSGPLRNPGHGTATLSILAGGKFDASPEGYTFNDYLGGAPQAEVIPVRVGNSVVQFRTSDVAKGFDYATQLCAHDGKRVHVLSMSMGGVASAAWADAVNEAWLARATG